MRRRSVFHFDFASSSIWLIVLIGRVCMVTSNIATTEMSTESTGCRPWCETKLNPWKEKCAWSPCEDCSECSSMCRSSCLKSTDSWKEKCTWTQCDVCRQCRNSWMDVGYDYECDLSKGEIALKDPPPGKQPSVALCQRACEDNSECQSITYYGSSGWCRLHSTMCEHKSIAMGATSMRYATVSTTSAQKPTTIAAFAQGGLHCPQEDVWPRTAANKIVNKECPAGLSGIMTRVCTKDGNWQAVQGECARICADTEYYSTEKSACEPIAQCDSMGHVVRFPATLTQDAVCGALKICSCDIGGLRAMGKLCPKHGMTFCVGCYPGYYLVKETKMCVRRTTSTIATTTTATATHTTTSNVTTTSTTVTTSTSTKPTTTSATTSSTATTSVTTRTTTTTVKTTTTQPTSTTVTTTQTTSTTTTQTTSTTVTTTQTTSTSATTTQTTSTVTSTEAKTTRTTIAPTTRTTIAPPTSTETTTPSTTTTKSTTTLTTSAITATTTAAKLDRSPKAHQDSISTRTTGFSPYSKYELKTAVEACLELWPVGDCSAGLHGPMDKWDVSRITDMRGLFTNKNKFNQDLSKWDVSKVTAMDYMFAYATSFNQILCGEAWLKSQATKTDMFTNSAGSIAVQVCVCSAGKFLSRRGREVKCVSEVLESIPAATTTPALRIPNITMNVIRKPASLSVTTIVVIASAFVALVAFIVISITIVAWVVAKKRERFASVDVPNEPYLVDDNGNDVQGNEY